MPNSLVNLFHIESDPTIATIGQVFASASDCARAAGSLQRKIEAEEILKAIPAGRVNLALHHSALQSSAERGTAPTPWGAVNGIKNGTFGFHTALEHNPWWMVDLGSLVSISEIVIYNRMDNRCAPRANSLSVQIAGNDGILNNVYSHNGTTFGGLDGRPLRVMLKPSIARYVRIFLGEKQYLHLDEVEVY